MPKHARYGRRLKQVGAILEYAGQAVVDLFHLDCQIKHRGAAVELQLLQGQIRQFKPLPWGILEDEHHLEQRRVVQATRDLQRLDDLLERYFLMGKGLERDPSMPSQQLAKSGVSRKVGPYHEGVHKETDQRLQLNLTAASSWRAYHEIFAAGVAPQQRLKRGQQGHEQRRVHRTAHRLQSISQGA